MAASRGAAVGAFFRLGAAVFGLAEAFFFLVLGFALAEAVFVGVFAAGVVFAIGCRAVVGWERRRQRAPGAQGATSE